MKINLPFSNWKQWTLVSDSLRVIDYNKTPRFFWALRRMIKNMGFEDIDNNSKDL